MTDREPLEIQAREVTGASGARILVVSFVGEYGDGCQGNGDAEDMRRGTERALLAYPDAEGLVLDATRLGYHWGDRIGNAAPFVGIPYLWAISGSCPGLSTYVPHEMDCQADEWLFQPLERALETLAVRCRASRFELHDASGALSELVELEPRGRRFVTVDDGRRVSEALWFDRHPIEEVSRDGDGEVNEVTLWPFVDGAGGQSEACRFRARVRYEQGILRALDFAPYRHHFDHLAEILGEASDCEPGTHSLPLDWLESVRVCTDVRELGFDETVVTDAEVEQVLRTRRELQKIRLNHTRVTEGVLELLAAAPALEEISLFGVSIPEAALRAFARAHPNLHVGYHGMFGR